ncbi:tautomerase family protein [Williamsia sterculiae]|uniref:4-oxalocrotonate tautomerase n=1 Tax=Williamsia sterculiae TaxID=1344003 RepID=A0A1N7EK55_9NOCA|nr:tautomerase family protein [Williamsia sterculiae]SIR88470.1 4-oxalocrotonate tautomerase [Williamsia sterculiae]
MPHVEIWHFPATVSDERREQLERDVVTAVARAYGVDAGVVSIGTHAVDPGHWDQVVYQPLIGGRDDDEDSRLLRRPNY